MASSSQASEPVAPRNGIIHSPETRVTNGHVAQPIEHAAKVSRKGYPDGWAFVNQLVAASRPGDIVNLGQGSFGFSPPNFVTDPAKNALDRNETNQYSPTNGRPRLRQAIAAAYEPAFGRKIDPVKEVLVTTGANEGILSAFFAFLEPGDEVLVFEPFYDQFIWQIRLTGAVNKFVPMKPPSSKNLHGHSAGQWEVDMDELRKARNSRTKMLVLNSPHNPTGKVFSPTEVAAICDFCVEYNIMILSDEVYDRLSYVPFTRPANVSAEAARLTLTAGSAGKCFFVTGWRVGWILGPEHLIRHVATAHMQICYSTVSPLQEAVAVGLEQADDYDFWSQSRLDMEKRVNKFIVVFEQLGIQYFKPEGGYYIVVNMDKIRVPQEYAVPEEYGQVSHDFELSWFLIKAIGVAAIPVSIFYTPENVHLAANLVRFSVAKTDQDLEEAMDRLVLLKNYM